MPLVLSSGAGCAPGAGWLCAQRRPLLLENACWHALSGCQACETFEPRLASCSDLTASILRLCARMGGSRRPSSGEKGGAHGGKRAAHRGQWLGVSGASGHGAQARLPLILTKYCVLSHVVEQGAL